MRIGVITLSRIKIEQGTFYNMQDVGLAKALAGEGHDVTLYRLTEDAEKCVLEDGVTMLFHKVKGFGKQAVTGFSFLDGTMERLICFSDNQVSFPSLCRWCRKKEIVLLPYVGVLYSNSSNPVVRKITDFLVKRNIRQYRNMKVYVKTPGMENILRKLKVKNTETVPVCLDETLLHKDISAEEITSIRREYGYQDLEKLMLFVGRMEPEKEPLEMLHVFSTLYRKHPEYRLFMVGKGVLYEKVRQEIAGMGLESAIQIRGQVLNKEMWKLYCISDCLINLNRHEIFGMAILEAMYYRCPVIAMHAPGPDSIIQDENTGYLCAAQEQLTERIETVMEKRTELQDTRKRIETAFLWNSVIEKFID